MSDRLWHAMSVGLLPTLVLWAALAFALDCGGCVSPADAEVSHAALVKECAAACAPHGWAYLDLTAYTNRGCVCFGLPKATP